MHITKGAEVRKLLEIMPALRLFLSLAMLITAAATWSDVAKAADAPPTPTSTTPTPSASGGRELVSQDNNADLIQLPVSALQGEIDTLRNQIKASEEKLRELKQRKDALSGDNPAELKIPPDIFSSVDGSDCKTAEGQKRVQENGQRTRDRLRPILSGLDASMQLRDMYRSSPLAQSVSLLENYLPPRNPDAAAGCQPLLSALIDLRTSVGERLAQSLALIRKNDDALTASIGVEGENGVVLRKRLRDALDVLKKNSRSETIVDKLPILVIILGVFSLAIMVMVRRFKEPIQKNWVESGQVIQFMTVTILVNVILVLGLAQILTGETLGTLLGGIAGYMLSQGVARAVTGARQPPTPGDIQ